MLDNHLLKEAKIQSISIKLIENVSTISVKW